MLFRSTEAMSKYVSGVILYDETIWQNAKDGTPLVKLIEQSGAIPGIKVDEGTQALPQCPGELVTVGLDKLAERLKKYYERGARFAKWRAVIDIGSGIPTMTAISVNAHALARYAALCQAAQIVPIVEPEVLMDGDHDIDRCYDVTQRVLNKTFQELRVQRVELEGMVLKPNMAISGKKCAKQASVEEVAEKTVRLLKACVPAAVPGIAFLSGGQSDEEATAHLDAMNRIGGLPWKLTFSYGRALQAAPQKAWSGKAENVAAGQRAFTHRARMNALASKGEWETGLEKKVGLDLATKPVPPRPAPRLYLATPEVDDPSQLAASLPGAAGRGRRRGGAAAAEADRPAHHDLAREGAGARDPECRRGAAARRPCRTGGARRRRRRASDRPRRAGGCLAVAEARPHRRRRRPRHAARFDGRGRTGRGLRAVRRARCQRAAALGRRRLPSACNGGTNCSSRLASALPSRARRLPNSQPPARILCWSAISSGPIRAAPRRR